MTRYTNSLLTAEEVRSIACPKCLASSGAPCATKDGHNHVERVRRARSTRAVARKAKAT